MVTSSLVSAANEKRGECAYVSAFLGTEEIAYGKVTSSLICLQGFMPNCQYCNETFIELKCNILFMRKMCVR
ncbi:hypothetical protein C1H46_028878 [Malus baccata]|uniref:Uncharacterized protein n=1 Tax=Malus baccata TaxID=106549 RepID=A0A540LGH2_MALBA|nr:hypothetical protein C1H46_028878 [Malus baccata]